MILLIVGYIVSVLICWILMIGVSIMDKTENLLDFEMGLIPIFNLGVSVFLFIIMLLKITENRDKQC